MNPTLRTLATAAVALVGFATLVPIDRAFAADAPSSVLALFERIPDLPASAEEAATWVDRQQRLIQPQMLALAAEIDAHRHAVDAIAGARAPQQQAQSAARLDDLGRGMAAAGIDMQRMQRDPAYAQQVQQRMKSMSPQELMALSQTMAQPMNRDPRLANEAQLQADESAAVRSAAEAGFAYSSTQVERMNAHAAIWREADAAVARINARPLKVSAPKPRIEWDNIGCDKACQAQWDRYASQALPLMVARETEILQVRRAALRRQRAAVAAEIRAADRHLAATGYGAAARSQLDLMRITGYDAAAIGELMQLMTRIGDSVKNAAVVPLCGKQLVLVPGAVCH